LRVSVVRLNLLPTNRRELEVASAGGIVEGKSGIRAEAIRRTSVKASIGTVRPILGFETDPAPRGLRPVFHADFSGMDG
jgi:hypothetical protein